MWRRRKDAGDKEEIYNGEKGWVQETKRKDIIEKEVGCRRQEKRYNGEGSCVQETREDIL